MEQDFHGNFQGNVVVFLRCPWLNCAHSGVVWKISSLCTSYSGQSCPSLLKLIRHKRYKGRGSALSCLIQLNTICSTNHSKLNRITIANIFKTLDLMVNDYTICDEIGHPLTSSHVFSQCLRLISGAYMPWGKQTREMDTTLTKRDRSQIRYRYFVNFWLGISIFANFSNCIAVLGTPRCPPQKGQGYTFQFGTPDEKGQKILSLKCPSSHKFNTESKPICVCFISPH